MNTISEGQHIELTKAVMDLLDDWGLSATDIINVLSLPSKTRTRHLQRYRDNTPLPRDEQTMFRIEHLGACPRIGVVARESHFEPDFSIK